jgi:hypothetical protein
MTTLLTEGSLFPRTRRAVMSATLVLVTSLVSLAMLAGGAAAQQGPKQIQLTAKHIDQYIASYKELTPLFDKLEAAGDNPDPKLVAAVDPLVKKYGFANTDEYESVAMSLSAVTNGIDPQTKQFADPIVMIKQQIADVQKDKSLSAADRQQALDELNAALAEQLPVEFMTNIPLVTRYYDRLVALAQ